MNDETLLTAKEALRRCGYTHRNSLPALIKKVGAPIKRDGLNYFRKSDIDRYIERQSNPPISTDEALRLAQEAAEYADRGEAWPPTTP